MRLFVTGGSAFEQHVVTETIEAIIKANDWVLAALVLEDATHGAALTAYDWARNRSVRVLENPEFMLEKPDAAVIFPGKTHKAFRATMAAGIPVYRVTPEGRYTKYT